MTFSIHRASFRPVLPAEAEAIKAAYAAGETHVAIAARFGRSSGTISKILSGKRYEQTTRQRDKP